MALAHAIAERIHGLRYEDLTPTALEWTRAAFIDKVHVTEQALRVRAHPQDQLLEVLVYEDVRHHLAQDLLEVSSVVVR